MTKSELAQLKEWLQSKDMVIPTAMITKLVTDLETAIEALEYIAWPGPERDHWDRVNKAEDALKKLRGPAAFTTLYVNEDK
jgi:hypothetical protein